MQQHWLRQQNELVKKTKEADEQSKTVDNLKKQLVIMEQKRLRIDGEYKCVRVCVCPMVKTQCYLLPNILPTTKL